MASKWHQKKAKQAEIEFEKSLQNAPDVTEVKNLTSEVAMGGGDVQVFEKKMTKEEKKAAKKAAREAKKKQKGGKKGGDKDDDDDDDNNNNEDEDDNVVESAAMAKQQVEKLVDGGNAGAEVDDGIDHKQADELAAAGTICTFSASRKGVDARSRDVNVTNFTLQHMGAVLLDETEIVLNHGNRYGLIGRNGCGKSTLLKALGCRAVPIPRGIDIFYLQEEVEPSDTMTALDAVMSVDEERLKLENLADELNHIVSNLAEKIAAGETPEDNDPDGKSGYSDKTYEEQQEEVMETLNTVYERLDALDAATAEVRARTILKGLGFTHAMQSKFTKDFSGGWRMRVSLARALFIQPVCLLLDEPTNHLDMEAVIWLEDYLSKWDRILLLISHSQDFLNNVCTHMIHFNNRKKLQYYDGNYDQYVKTKTEKEENQRKQYKWEQEQIKSMKEYIARFGHGTSKNAKQAQSKEKVLAKMIRQGLTEKPEEEKPLNFKFADPGMLPPPVLAFHDVEFGYPNCKPLYSNVNFGVDLDSRIALVGPNGAGKTTLVKLMAGELQPTSGDIRPHGHLKLGRFTQHFVDVLDLELTPLEFFETMYPGDPRDEQRKYLGRFGVSGKMQVQKMAELSDGQKSRVVFAKLGRDVPHILLLDEPTNHLDMESIDALAKAINEFEGGLVLVSHDMRLISQVAKEIWICDNKTVEKYKGDILRFKMDMRAQMGIDQVVLKGDASEQVAAEEKEKAKQEKAIKKKAAEEKKKADAAKIEIIAPKQPPAARTQPPPVQPPVVQPPAVSTTENGGTSLAGSDQNQDPPKKKYIPPHLRKRS